MQNILLNTFHLKTRSCSRRNGGNVNLVCIASETGISPFVGLVDAIGTKQGFYTIAHQCKSSDLFLSNSQRWLDFTACNPGAIVMDFISGDQSRRNCPMRYFIRNGAFQETTLLNRHNSSAYYFECFSFQTRLKEVYNSDGSCLNLAYYCVGWDIAVKPIQKIAREEGLIFEFIIECYGVSTSIKEDNERCLRAPYHADSEAFTTFLGRQARSNSVMLSTAAKYAEIALAAPDNSKVVRIASELQATLLRRQVHSEELCDAQLSAQYLKALLKHVPIQDEDARRWSESQNKYQESFHHSDANEESSKLTC